jgi:Metallo-peptidase family M12
MRANQYFTSEFNVKFVPSYSQIGESCNTNNSFMKSVYSAASVDNTYYILSDYLQNRQLLQDQPKVSILFLNFQDFYTIKGKGAYGMAPMGSLCGLIYNETSNSYIKLPLNGVPVVLLRSKNYWETLAHELSHAIGIDHYTIRPQSRGNSKAEKPVPHYLMSTSSTNEGQFFVSKFTHNGICKHLRFYETTNCYL